MAISFDASKKIFKLDTSDTTYAFAIHNAGYLLHLYYGTYLPDNNLLSLLNRGSFPSFSPDNPHYVGTGFSPDIAPSEYSCNGTGDFRIPALQRSGEPLRYHLPEHSLRELLRRRSFSEVVAELLEQYRERHWENISEYEKVKKAKIFKRKSYLRKCKPSLVDI